MKVIMYPGQFDDYIYQTTTADFQWFKANIDIDDDDNENLIKKNNWIEMKSEKKIQ